MFYNIYMLNKKLKNSILALLFSSSLIIGGFAFDKEMSNSLNNDNNIVENTYIDNYSNQERGLDDVYPLAPSNPIESMSMSTKSITSANKEETLSIKFKFDSEPSSEYFKGIAFVKVGPESGKQPKDYPIMTRNSVDLSTHTYNCVFTPKEKGNSEDMYINIGLYLKDPNDPNKRGQVVVYNRRFQGDGPDDTVSWNITSTSDSPIQNASFNNANQSVNVNAGEDVNLDFTLTLPTAKPEIYDLTFKNNGENVPIVWSVSPSPAGQRTKYKLYIKNILPGLSLENLELKIYDTAGGEIVVKNPPKIYSSGETGKNPFSGGSLTLNSGEDITTGGNKKINWKINTASSNPAALTEATYYLNGVKKGQISPPVSKGYFNIEIPNPNTPQKVTMVVKDSTGHEETLQGPTFQNLNSFTDGTLTTSDDLTTTGTKNLDYKINMAATNPAPLTKVTYYVNGSEKGVINSPEPEGSFTVDINDNATEQKVTIKVEDTLGKTATIQGPIFKAPDSLPIESFNIIGQEITTGGEQVINYEIGKPSLPPEITDIKLFISKDGITPEEEIISTWTPNEDKYTGSISFDMNHELALKGPFKIIAREFDNSPTTSNMFSTNSINVKTIDSISETNGTFESTSDLLEVKPGDVIDLNWKIENEDIISKDIDHVQYTKTNLFTNETSEPVIIDSSNTFEGITNYEISSNPIDNGSYRISAQAVDTSGNILNLDGGVEYDTRDNQPLDPDNNLPEEIINNTSVETEVGQTSIKVSYSLEEYQDGFDASNSKPFGIKKLKLTADNFTIGAIIKYPDGTEEIVGEGTESKTIRNSIPNDGNIIVEGLEDGVTFTNIMLEIVTDNGDATLNVGIGDIATQKYEEPKGTNVGAIVGGIIGGLLFILLIVLIILLWFLLWIVKPKSVKKESENSIRFSFLNRKFDKEIEVLRGSKLVDKNGKEYEFKLEKGEKGNLDVIISGIDATKELKIKSPQFITTNNKKKSIILLSYKA